VAVRAGEEGVGRVAARAVDQLKRLGAVVGGEMALGPAHEADDHRVQVERPLGQASADVISACSSLWDGVTAALQPDYRCVAPTLPVGAHRHGRRDDADLSLRGIARLVAEFLDRLDLHDVTLVGTDTGGALVQLLLEAAEDLPRFDRPALIVWASEDRVMPPEHGRRLADLLPQGRLVEIDDSYTLIPLDQPARLAEAMRAA